jgi:hypothetical protein
MLITRHLEFDCPDEVYRDIYGTKLTLEQVRYHETPNYWADATRHRSD